VSRRDRPPVAWRPPPRPPWVERFLAAAGVLGSEAVAPLDASDLVARAVGTTGLDDFGGDAWREPFGVLCDAAAGEARLHALGAVVTRAEILRLLGNRLRIVAAEPEVAGAPDIVAPIVITGSARSGTSILHELLALDPAHRTPAAWEVLWSVPVPTDRDGGPGDPRVHRADREVRLWDDIAPEYRVMHENGGALPHECIFLTAHEFASEHFSGVLDVPSYAGWMATHDLGPAYEWHRRQLKLLGAHRGPRQWVLKAPSHLSQLPALFAVYPDARVVITHRDPLRTVPSTISLMATLRWMRSDDVNVGGLAQVMARAMAALADAVDGWRSDGTIPEGQVVDVAYADLVRDPVATLRRLYATLERDWTPGLEDAVRSYLAAKPQGRHGAHRYGLSDFGLDPGDVRDRFAAYVARHDVAPEPGAR
jgi:hypothetical protein